MRFLLSFGLILCISCTHAPRAEFDQHLSGLRCEDAFKSIPELRPSEKMRTNAEWAAKHVVGYTYVGINYTAEIITDITVGTLLFVGLCGPMIAAKVYSSTPYSGPMPMCLPLDFSNPKTTTTKSKGMGRKAWDRAQQVMCPDVEPLALSMEQVATCYENRKTPEDLKRALTTLESLENSEDFFKCVPAETRDRIIEKSGKLQAQSSPELL